MAEIEQFVDSDGQQWVVLMGPDYVDGAKGQILLELSLRVLDKGIRHVVINLEAARVVNSVGISRLIQMIESFDEKGGSIAFCSVNSTISKTLRIMGLLNKAALYDSVESAAAQSGTESQ